MTYRASFKDGQHVKAARAIAGLTQTQLAAIAGLHPNSVKRLERARTIFQSHFAAHKVGEALRTKGVIASTIPMPLVRLTDASDELG